MENQSTVPILIPLAPEEFWNQIRTIVREEVGKQQALRAVDQMTAQNVMQTPGLTAKPLYKMEEICLLFKITKPTIYGWIKHGTLRPVKIRSRVYFLGSEVQHLLEKSR